MKFKGKVAIVSGGARDIGRAVSLKLAAEGAKIVIGYIGSSEQAEETLEMMLELLRRIIGSNVILGAMNENSEIMILLKKLTKVFNNEWSQDNSKFMKRLI